MHIRIAVALLIVVLGVPALLAQTEAVVDATETETTDAAGTTTTTTKTTTITFTQNPPSAPAWTHLVRMSAMAAPIAFLLLAWMLGMFAHHRIVRREQALFPVQRGSRAPQTTPMIISAALFTIPLIAFAIFEIRSRRELTLGVAGINDEWLPVHQQSWIALAICIALALMPWLFARRADAVTQGGD